MHEGINRQDGRHWCAPDSTDGSVSPLECECGKVWILEDNIWSELPDIEPEEKV